MEKTNTEKEVINILKEKRNGLTITELSELSDTSRSTVRIALARLEGQGDISYRNIGMAKVYVFREGEYD